MNSESLENAERRAMARALAAEQQRFELVVQATQAGIVDWDIGAGSAWYSERFKALTGHPAEADTAQWTNTFEFVHPEDRDRVHASFLATLKGDSVPEAVTLHEPVEFRLLRLAKDPLWVRSMGLTQRDVSGRATRFVAAIIDISAQREQEQHLRDQIALKRLESEGVERARLMSELLDVLPISVAMRDPEGRYILVNADWEKSFGVGREDALGRLPHELPGWQEDAARREDAKQIEQIDRAILEQGPGFVPQPQETLRLGHHYLITRRALFDSGSGPLGVLSASIDLTERHAIEEALATEQRRLALVVRASRVGTLDWDGTTRSVYYSPRFKEILGYPPDTDTSGWRDGFDSFVHPEDKERVSKVFRQHILGTGPEGKTERHPLLEYRLRRADGSYVWVEAQGLSVRDARGYCTRFTGSYTDITERRAHDEALNESVRLASDRAKFINDLFDSVPVALAMRDAQGRFLYVNRSWESMVGSKRERIIGKTMREVFPAEVAERRLALDREAFARGPGSTIEFVDREYAGMRLTQSSAVMADSQGHIVGIVIASLDTTEKYQVEQALALERERQNEALKENVRLREEVERMSRHDLKTPLNSIIAVPRLLREERSLSREEEELLGIVERAGYRILSMVNLSLDLYKMEQGSYVFRPDAVDVADLLQKVMLDLHSHAESKNLALRVVRVDSTGAAPPAYAWAEELLCYSMFANLLKNAVEASPEGGTVTVKIEAGESLRLTFHNPGVVPEEIRASFFDKYASIGKASGTGLGTYSARLMARMQEGDIAMRTSAQEGTTISVRLRVVPAGKLPASMRRTAERTQLRPAYAARLPALRLLLVDDDEYNLLILRRYLEAPQLQIDTAINGRLALEKATAALPDVVIMDLDMPVMGGMEAIAKLREREQEAGAARCIAIVLSSHDDEDTRRQALSAGFDLYLSKPVTREVLQTTLVDMAAPLADRDRQTPQAPHEPGDETRPVAPEETVRIDPALTSAISGFLDSRRAAVTAMGAALAANDRETLRRLAHKLAGSFALYGFRWAALESRALQDAASQAPVEELAAQVHALGAYLERVKVEPERDEGSAGP